MKKGLIKAGFIGFLLLFVFGIILFSFFLSANPVKDYSPLDYKFFNFNESKIYSINTTLKFDFGGYKNFKLTIITPSGERIFASPSDDKFLFKFEEEGNYSLSFNRGNGKKFQAYIFISSDTEEPPTPPEPEEPPIIDELIQAKAEINQPVSWSKSINESNTTVLIEIPPVLNLTLVKENGESVNFTLITFEGKDYIQLEENVSEPIKLEYVTESPKLNETVISETVKEVVVSSLEGLNYKDVLSYTQLPREISEKSLIKIYWKEQGIYLDFEARDTNNNGLFDYVEWIVPHLSNQTFEIIVIVKAEHLSSDKNFISDIYSQVKELDNIWSETILENEYIRVTFEIPLDSTRDITLYPRIISGSPIIEVYEKDESELIATFEDLVSNEYNKIYLTNLIGEQDTFDLKILGGSVEFDHIIDPTTIYNINPSFSAVWGRPTSSNRWLAGTNATIGQYNNMNSENSVYAVNAMAGGTSNDEPFWRFNFTINENVALISSIYIKFTGWDNATEVGTLYVWRFANSTWMPIGTTPSSNGNITRNIDADISSYIDANKQLVLVVEGANYDAGDSLIVDHVQVTIQYIDPVPPTFTLIPANSSLFYRNQSLLVKFTGTDDIQFDSYSVNDTRFSINSTGFLRNTTTLGVGNYEINVTINDSSNNINWTRYNVQINKSNYFDCGVYFNATSPITFPVNFRVYTNCSSAYTLYRNGTSISNNSIQNNGVGYFNYTVQRTDTENYTNTVMSRFFTVNKNQENCRILFNETFPLSYKNTFLVWANCTSSFLLLRNDSLISNNSEQLLGAGVYNFSMLRDDSSNYSIYYNETQIIINDPIFPIVDFGSNTPNNNSKFARTWFVVEASVIEDNEKNITFDLYNSTRNLVNSSTYTDLRRTINWTSLPEGIYYYNITVFDTYNNKNSSLTRKITLNFSLPNINFVYPTESNGLSFQRNWIYVNISTSNVNEEINITFGLYNSTGLVNQSIFTDLRRTINWTSLPEENYYYNVTLFDNPDGRISTLTRSTSLDLTHPNINVISPENNQPISYSTQNLIAEITDNLGLSNFTIFVYNQTHLINQTEQSTSGTYSLTEVPYTFEYEGIFNWSYLAFDLAGNYFETYNFTLFYDSTYPKIDYIYPTLNNNLNVSENWIYVNVSVEEENEVNITFDLYYSNRTIFNSSTYTDSRRMINWTNIEEGNYYYNVTIFDKGLNKNYTQTRKIGLDFTPPVIDFVFPTEEDNFIVERDWVYVNVSVIENNEKNITFELYDSFYSPFNISTYTNLRRTINWTGLNAGVYYYNATVFDFTGNSDFTYTRKITLTSPAVIGSVLIDADASQYSTGTGSVSATDTLHYTGGKNIVRLDNNRLISFWNDGGNDEMCEQSDDEGTTWENQVTVAGTFYDMAVATNGTSVFYLIFNSGSGTDMDYQVNNEGSCGMTVTTQDITSLTDHWRGDVAYNAVTNRWEVCTMDNDDFDLWYASSPVGTISWTTLEVSAGTYRSCSIDVDGNGNVFIAADDEGNTDITVFNSSNQFSTVTSTTAYSSDVDGVHLSIRGTDILVTGEDSVTNGLVIAYSSDGINYNTDTFGGTFSDVEGCIDENDNFHLAFENGSGIDYIKYSAGSFNSQINIADMASALRFPSVRCTNFPLNNRLSSDELELVYTDTATNVYFANISIDTSDVSSPTFNSSGVNSTSSIMPALFSIWVNDNSALHPAGQYIFSTNNTGVWINDSIILFSETPSWANVTKILNSTVDTIVGYRWYFKDTSGNSNSTPIYTLTTTTPLDTTSPYFTAIPDNASLFYGNESLSVDFDATDETAFGYYRINDTRFSITQVGLLTNETVLGAGNYEINVTINDSLNNINWTIYTVQINKSNYYDCGVYFNTSNPITYPDSFIVYTNCSSAYTLYRNGTSISNGSTINSGAGYYNLTVRRTDTANYTNWFSSEFFTVNKNPEEFNVLFNTTSPIIYPETFLVWANSTTPFTLRRNGTVISNNSEQNNGAGYFNFSAQRTDTANYSYIYNQSFFTVNKATDSCGVYFNTSSPITYPDNFIVYTNCSSAYTLYRNGTSISNGSTINSGAGYYNLTVRRTDTANYTNWFSSEFFTVNKNSENCIVLYNETSPLAYPKTFLMWANCTTSFNLYRNGTLVSNNSEQALSIGVYNFSLQRTDVSNYSINFNQSQFKIVDTTPPYFITIPNNASLFYGNESLSVDFDAADETTFGHYRINDTRFSITQAGILTNATSLAVGNYEINVTINDTFNNINWTRYKVQINKSNYYDCGVYFNTSSPIIYPNNFIVYTNCSSAYALYRNGTAISNNTLINSGAGYYNLTVRRTDTANYTNWFSSEFFTVNKNQEEFNVLFNTTSPIIYPETFLVWANSTTPFTLRRNGTVISNNSEQNNGAGYFNFSAQRLDIQNYSITFNDSQFTVNKNPENCQVLFNETSPIDYPETFLVWANCTTPFTLRRNGTIISNNTEQILEAGSYNFSFLRIDIQNYSIIFNETLFTINRDVTPPYFTTIPDNASLFYGNESLSVTFTATDNIEFGYFKINDTRFSITQAGLLTNISPMAAGNYEINVTINDSSNNINWTIYTVQINKSNYYDCGVYFNTPNPITYPDSFIVYTNCSSAYTLYRNGTSISNGSTINSGAGYYNLTVRRTDTANYTNWFSSEFFTVNKNPEEFNVLFNTTSPIIYPETFLVWANSTTPFTLRRNGTVISNNSEQNNGAGYFNFSAQRTDTANYSYIYNQSFFTVNKATDSCGVYFNTSSPITYPDNFIVYTNCSSAYTLYRNGTSISNGSTINSGAGYYNLTVRRTDTANYTNWFSSEFFTVNKNQEEFNVLFNASSPIYYPDTFLVYANSTTPFTLRRNGTVISNNSEQRNGAGYFNFSAQRTDTANYSYIYNQSEFIVNKNLENCQVLFNETSPLQYPKTFLVWTNCSSLFTLYRNGTIIGNNSEQSLAISAYNFSLQRTDTSNYSIHFNQSQFRIVDTIFPNATLISPENNTLTSSNTQNLTVNATDNVELSNMTLSIYNQTNLINQTTQTISGTQILTGIVYVFGYDGIFNWFYKIFDLAGNSFNTGNNTITIDTTNPIVSLIYPSNAKVISNPNIWFASNFSDVNNLTNTSFYLWDSTDTLINITSINISGTFNFTNLSVILPYYSSFKWNYFACDSLSNCGWKSTNYSLIYESPRIGLSVLYPSGNIEVGQNKFFNVTLNISCLAGECGTINVSLDPISWWNSSWVYRKQINVTNNNASTILQSGYSFNFTLDTTGNKFLDNGDDIRIVYYNGTNNIELDRINTSAFNSSSTIIWFKLQKNISASGMDSNYSIYYGNQFAVNPPINKSNVYLFYDNFADSNAWSTFSGACSASSSQGNPIPSLFMSGSGTTDRCYATNFNLPASDFILEADVYISSTGGRGIRNIGFKHTTAHASGYIYRLQTSGGDGGFFTLSGTGTWAKLGSNDPDYSPDTWHTLKLLIRGSNFTAWVDNVYRNSVVSSTYSNTKIGTQDDGGADTDSYVDNYIIRGYIFPEPSPNLGNEETVMKTGLVSTIPGTIPFYTNVSNPYTTLYLTKEQNQIVSFYINATGTGTHVFFAFANLTNNLSINNITSSWNVTIDTIPPKLTIINPLNQSYSIPSVNFNISGDESLDLCKFTLNNWQINYTMNRLNLTSFYYRNTSMNDNTYTAKFSCTDLAGNINNSENINFTIDVYGPNISLITPLNATYSNNTLQNLSFSAIDNVGLKNATLYIFNSSGSLINFTNIYLSGKTILTGIIYTFAYDGVFNWFYSIFDLADHQQNTQNNTITIDTKNPLINYGSGTENNFANVSQNWIYINITLNETNFANLTFYLYNGSSGYSLFNQTTYNDLRRTINWTNLAEGLYWYNVTVIDLALNKNITQTRQIRLDTSPPYVKTVFPNNFTYGYNITLLNYTVSDPLMDKCWYNINGTSNVSITCGQNISTFLSDGTYTWNIYSNDTLGHLGFDSVSFKVATEFPAVIIYYPQNRTYSYNVSAINFTATDTNLDKCWYVLNGGGNISTDCSLNITNLISQEGINSLWIYANDTDSNIGAAFVFFSVDTTSPNLTIINPKNQYYYPENIFFNVSGSENLDYCKFTLNNWTTNYTMNRYNSTDFNYVLSSIGEGDYVAKFWCNDTLGNINDTTNISFSTYYPIINLDLVYPTNSINVIKSNSFNFTVNVSCGVVDCGVINVTLDPPGNWWNQSWNYRKGINLSGIGSQLTDFQINISMNLTEDYLLGKVKSDCSDIRFTNDSSIEMSYWTESCYINGSNSIFWVKIPSIAASENTTIYIYYGNSNALNASNGTTTFDYFDSGNDVGTWTVVNTAGQTSAQGLPQPSYYAASTNGNYMYKNIGLTTNSIIEYNSRSDGLGNLFFLTNSAGNGQHMRLETRSSNSAGMGSATGWTSWSAPSQTCSNLATNTWFNFRLVIGSTTAQSYINNVACGGAYSFSNNGGYIGLVGDALGGSYTTWWDNFRVRKYSSTMPIYFFGNEENKAKGIVSTNIDAIPFFADQNPKTTVSLNKGESQLVNFVVNVTGDSGTYEFFAFANLIKNSSVVNYSSSVNITIISHILSLSLIYPENFDNFSNLTIPFFNFSVNGSEFSNCQLFGNWGGWNVKQTIYSPPTETVLNFSSEEMGNDGDYVWNIKCTDTYGASIMNSINYTFGVFLFPDAPNPLLVNITQTNAYGTGEVFLSWNITNHSDYYRIYSTDNLGEAFTLLAQVKDTNYTDSSANTTRRRFYKISNWNPTGENFSNVTLGKTIYYLKRKPDVNTRNWLGFYLENKTLTNANESFNQISNITSFTMWNSTIQGRVTCNNFSCPEFPSCTETNCNFDLNDGISYEVNLNSSSPVFTNWSLVGVLKSEATLPLIKNSTSYGKNWISLYANSSLANAAGLISSVSFSDAVTNWDEFNQISQGYTPYAFFPMPIGENFILEPEKGYEISVTQNSIYTQS